MSTFPPKKPRPSSERGDGARPRKPALSRDLLEALLPPAPAPASASIFINLAAGAVLNIRFAGLAGVKEE